MFPVNVASGPDRPPRPMVSVSSQTLSLSNRRSSERSPRYESSNDRAASWPRLDSSCVTRSTAFKSGTVQSSRSRRPSRGTLHRLVQVPVCLQPHPQLRRGLQELRKLCVARRSLSTGRNHLSSWFQIAKMRRSHQASPKWQAAGLFGARPSATPTLLLSRLGGYADRSVTSPTGSRTTCKTGTAQIDNCLKAARMFGRRTARRPARSLAGTAVGRVSRPILQTCSIAATGGRSPRARASSPRRAASPTPDRPADCAAHRARAAA